MYQDAIEPPVVFIVDDSDDVSLLIETILDQRGFRTRCFQSAEEALFAVNVVSPDLVICDLELPRLNGFEFVQALRLQGLKTPVLAVSGHTGSGMKLRAFSEGFDGFIEKPFTAEVLVVAVNALAIH